MENDLDRPHLVISAFQHGCPKLIRASNEAYIELDLSS
jgi:hypothetical protein